MSEEKSIATESQVVPNTKVVSGEPVRWKPCLDCYQELRALQFPAPEQFAAAAELLWSNELRDLPYDLVGRRTIIVPVEAVPCFAGIECTVSDVLLPDELPPEELAELRKERGPY